MSLSIFSVSRPCAAYNLITQLTRNRNCRLATSLRRVVCVKYNNSAISLSICNFKRTSVYNVILWRARSGRDSVLFVTLRAAAERLHYTHGRRAFTKRVQVGKRPRGRRKRAVGEGNKKRKNQQRRQNARRDGVRGPHAVPNINNTYVYTYASRTTSDTKKQTAYTHTQTSPVKMLLGIIIRFRCVYYYIIKIIYLRLFFHSSYDHIFIFDFSLYLSLAH